MQQKLEQILEQDCTNFVKIEKLDEYMKQYVFNFVNHLHANDLQMFSPTEFFDIYENYRRYNIEEIYKSFQNYNNYE
jgi:hypothetical protein